MNLLKLKSSATAVNILRGVFYASTIIAGIILVLQQLDSGNVGGFRWFTMILSAVFAVEIFSGWALHYKMSQQRYLEIHSRPLLRAQEIFNHLVLPANLFIWTLAFCYFNQQFQVRVLVLVASFVIFVGLFAYIRAFYVGQKELISALHAIFDLSKLYTFFLISDSIIHAAGDNLSWTPFLIATLAFGLNFLLLWREHKVTLQNIYVTLFSVLLMLASIYVLLLLGATTALQVSLLCFVGYYLTAAFTHHYLDRDLTRKLLLEYLLTLVLAVVFLQGLN